jgi:hypothetical protein
MSAEQTDDSWSAVTSDLRDTLTRSGVSETVVERVFATVAPAVAAIERERGMVEPELLLALIAVAADSFQRTQPQCERSLLYLPTVSEAQAGKWATR